MSCFIDEKEKEKKSSVKSSIVKLHCRALLLSTVMSVNLARPARCRDYLPQGSGAQSTPLSSPHLPSFSLTNLGGFSLFLSPGGGSVE